MLSKPEVIKPLNQTKSKKVSIFLAGSIDMGAASFWQDRVIADLVEYDITIYNPRRDDWDSTWKQDPVPGTPFYDQVNWELEQLETSDIIVYYFADFSRSPITLLEFGLYAKNPRKPVIVYCNNNFYRYGNVQITASRYDIPVYTTYSDFINAIKEFIRYASSN